MGNIYGTQLHPREMLAQSQKTLRKSIRELEDEGDKLQREEARLKLEIRVTMKRGQQPLARSMAKGLVRVRNSQAKCYEMRTNLEAVSRNIQMLSSTAAMTEAMRTATLAMYRMNRQVGLESVQRMLMQFEKESGLMEMKQEMMDDAVDGVTRQEDDDAREEEVINQIMDELSLGLAAQLASPPQQQARRQPAVPTDDDLLAERLNNLRK